MATVGSPSNGDGDVRWSLPGAQAMLWLRAIRANGDLTATEELVADLAPDPYGWHMPLAKTTGLRRRHPGESPRGFPGAGSAPGQEQES